MSRTCSVPWGVFGLAPPAERCISPARYKLRQACPRGHRSGAVICEDCLDCMRDLLPLRDWSCQQCLDVHREHVQAPVTARRIHPGKADA